MVSKQFARTMKEVTYIDIRENVREVNPELLIIMGWIVANWLYTALTFVKNSLTICRSQIERTRCA